MRSKRWRVSSVASCVVWTVVEADTAEEALGRLASKRPRWETGDVCGDVDLGDEECTSVVEVLPTAGPPPGPASQKGAL